MNIVKIKNLNKIYKETDIFKKMKKIRKEKGVWNINFEVKEGDIFSIIGLNGAGKTTIMKSLLGLLDIDDGEIDIFNKGKLKKESLREIGYLPEISYYPKSIKLQVLMEYYAELLEIKNKKEAVKKALKKVSLWERKESKLEDFSKGMLQKVGIAQAIINNPRLLFLDEPMSGLDPIARSEVIELIKELKKSGTTIFLNTHILGDIEKIGDSGIIVHKGRIIEKFNLHMLRKEIVYKIEDIEGNMVEVEKGEFEKLNIKNKIRNIEKIEFSLEEYFRNKIAKEEMKDEKKL